MAMGRPRKYKTGADLMDAVNDFIKYSTENKIRPTDYHLCEYLHMSPDTLENYAKRDKENTTKGKDKGKETESNTENTYSAAIKKLTLYRQDWYLRHAEINPKLTSIDIFALKQPCNGGWTDKQVTENTGAMALNVSISGASGEAFDDPEKTDK